MRLGTLLRLWRRNAGLTLRAAGARIGVHASTLRRMEQGEPMHGETLATVLVWLMGREERPANEAFTFEEESSAADQVAASEQSEAPAGELERNPYTFDREEAGPGESSSNTCELEEGVGGRISAGRIVASCITASGPTSFGFLGRYDSEGQLIERLEAPGAAIEEKQETAAAHPVHAVDQDAAVCGVRADE